MNDLQFAEIIARLDTLIDILGQSLPNGEYQKVIERIKARQVSLDAIKQKIEDRGMPIHYRIIEKEIDDNLSGLPTINE